MVDAAVSEDVSERYVCTSLARLICFQRGTASRYVDHPSKSPRSLVRISSEVSLISPLHPSTPGEPPSFTTYPRSQVVLDSTHRPGSSFTLSCGVSGSPEPTITWRRNGQTLGGENGSLLTVNNIVDGEDASVIGVNYTCEAENTFGRIRSIDAVIRLAGKFSNLYTNCITCLVSVYVHEPTQSACTR